MFNLDEHISEAATCKHLIITAGGLSLQKTYPEIITALTGSVSIMLFEINGYFTEIDPFRVVGEVENLTVIFSQDFGHCGHYSPLDQRVLIALKKRNSYLVQFESIQARRVARTYAITPYTIFVPPSTCREFRDYAVFQNEQDSLIRRGGSLVTALSAIPPWIESVTVYGADALTSGSDLNLSGRPHSYKALVELVRPYLDNVAKTKVVNLIC
jgi:hypothetical protein